MTPARRCELLVEQALEAAALHQGKEGLVTLVWLMDDDRREHVRECLESRGFVGTGPAGDVDRLMHETALEEGQQRLDEFRVRAENKGLRVETELLDGGLEASVMALNERHQPDRIYLPVGKLGPLVRLFGERAVKRLKKRLGHTLVTV